MEKLLELIASLVSDAKQKDEKILDLERKLDSCLLEIDEKNKKIKELTEENTRLALEKINPLQPNPARPFPYDPVIPWTPNQPSTPVNPWIPNQPTTPYPDWPYGPIITYVGHSNDTPYFSCEITC